MKTCVEPFVRAKIDRYPSLSRWSWKYSGGGTHVVNVVVFRWKRAGTIARSVPYLKSSRENQELSRFWEKIMKEDLG